ncbi:rhomboid family intramembrane serine protease [Pedobacter insulae]|uniref:Membrane associated serine protease, rhomboid family n=1 Tax=Pedobacter insulae TaxID=414048 RepID=A0A1I2ZRI8_9SPHI|nr:rhomboid family intramembrane serine protease [Pedobacter insulae]SFH40467.1 Membrane associated serine protease, rhomboid family [Pedobacter insulae]
MTRGLLHELYIKFFKSGSPAMLYIGINVLIFIVASLLGVFMVFSGEKGWLTAQIQEYFAFPATIASLPFRFYTIITYQFFHADFFHVLFNMLWLYWMGQIFLSFLKPRQFHFVYLGGGILGALTFLLLFHIVPVFSVQQATIIGSSACVMAILVATATLVPDYNLQLMLLGNVKLKYLVLAYIILDVIGTGGANAGGSIAHLGGALFGFSYIKLLQNGKDLSGIFVRKPKLKVVRNSAPKKSEHIVNQKEIDAILDKISKAGYDQLSKEEKEILFRASKN